MEAIEQYLHQVVLQGYLINVQYQKLLKNFLVSEPDSNEIICCSFVHYAVK